MTDKHTVILIRLAARPPIIKDVDNRSWFRGGRGRAMALKEFVPVVVFREG